MSRMPANRSRKMFAPRIASPLTSPRYWVITRPSRLGVVTTSMRLPFLLRLTNSGRRRIRQQHPASKNRRGVQQHPAEVNRPPDRLIPLQQAPLAQKECPVVLTPPDQRKRLGPGIADVHRDVPAVLAQPPERKRRPMSVALAPQGHHECQRHQELHQRATEHRQGLAIEGKQQMTGLMDGEIQAIQPPVSLRSAKTDPAVPRKYQRQTD